MSSPPAPQWTGRFSVMAAQRSLAATAPEVARCKRGTMWGIASATVTFANDGSVEHVLVGPPFTGTPTGQCVGEAMSVARVPSFAGVPGVTIVRFWIPR
jgi:hypothetical protein